MKVINNLGITKNQEQSLVGYHMRSLLMVDKLESISVTCERPRRYEENQSLNDAPDTVVIKFFQ